MSRLERIYEVHEILRDRRRGITRKELARRLGCSIPTVTRTLRAMRIYLGAPIEYHRDRGGYVYRRDPDEPAFELPGVWVSADELRALLTIESLLESLHPGLVSDCLGPLARRLKDLSVARRIPLGEVGRRVRLLAPNPRPAGHCFRTIASALLARHQIRITYHDRARDRVTERDVSPQRLVNYRGAWYLDAWCHMKKALRSFAVERITRADVKHAHAREIDDAELDRFFGSSYGIFAGEPSGWARLSFSPRAARWVADEVWHPRQEGVWLEDGRFELRIPFARTDELVGDILRWVPNVTVHEPPDLCEEVRRRLREALRRTV